MTSRSSRPKPPSGGPAATPPASDEVSPQGERIAKVIARAGICSRREAEKLVEDGHVTVNGKRLDSPAFNVTGREKITVNGFPLPEAEPVRLWRYHKPAGLVTTAKDPQERPTVFENLPEGMPRVVSVGRLDLNTEGLLLLTNDGELARLLELPSTGWSRRYRARAYGAVTQEELNRLKDGIEVEGVRYGSIEAVLDKVQGSNVWITLSLKEGKNREVKQVLSALGLRVNRLIRLSYGPFQMGDLEPGEVSVVPARVLVDQLGNHAARFRDRLPTERSGAAVKERTPASPAKAETPAKQTAWPQARSTDNRKGRRTDGPRTLHAPGSKHVPGPKRGDFHDGPGKPEGYRKEGYRKSERPAGGPKKHGIDSPRTDARKPGAPRPLNDPRTTASEDIPAPATRPEERNSRTVRQADAYTKPRAPRRPENETIGARGPDPYRKADGGPRKSAGFKSHEAPRRSSGFKGASGGPRKSDGFKSHEGSPKGQQSSQERPRQFDEPRPARSAFAGGPKRSADALQPGRKPGSFRPKEGEPRKSTGFKSHEGPQKTGGKRKSDGFKKVEDARKPERVKRDHASGKPSAKPVGKPAGKFSGKPAGKPGGKRDTPSSNRSGTHANRGRRP
ncbi:MAG: pseudouridine synthase [Parvibaculaceae bacterium]|nr:pseudouridine synthase [Parvibaculaceae bacterium]